MVLREGEGRLETILISPRGSGRWQLPKGIVEPGEDPEKAARREVAEEAGVQAEVLGRLGEIEYWYRTPGGSLRHKFVEFFLMSYLSGEPSAAEHEVDQARWTSVETAISLLTYDSERRMMENGRRLWRLQSGANV